MKLNRDTKLAKEISEYFLKRRFDRVGPLTILARSDNEYQDYSPHGCSITNILLELANNWTAEDTKIVIFTNKHQKIKIPTGLNFVEGYFGHPKFHDNEPQIKLSIQKLLELFESRYGRGSYYVRSFLESLYYGSGIERMIGGLDFNDIEDELDEEYKKTEVSFDYLLKQIKSLERLKSENYGHFKFVIERGDYPLLFDENSTELDKLLETDNVVIVRYEDGFRYDYFPAFLSYLLFYCSEKIKQSGKKGLFFIDNISWFTMIEERPYGDRLSISDFSDYALESASGEEISSGEGIINNRLVSSFLIETRYHHGKTREGYFSDIINKLIKRSWLAVFNINSLFYWSLIKNNALTLSSINGLMKLGEEHYKWRPGDKTPLLVGDCEHLHLIDDKSGFYRERKDVKRYPPLPQYNIFVSSPIKGYEDERELAFEVIFNQLFQEPIIQERFCREGKPSLEVCLEHVRKSDLLILILKDKAGSLHKGKPICRWEYEEARKHNIETLVFLSDNKERDNILIEWIKEIEDFEGGIYRGHYNFTSLDDLKEQLKADIPKSYPKIAEEKMRKVASNS